MKIKRADFRTLRMHEHFQCQTETKQLIEEFSPEELGIKELFTDKYLPLYMEEDETIVKIKKGSFTETRLETDQRRDNFFRGMVDINKAMKKHFLEDVVAAAKHLEILFNTYGDLARKPLQEETSAINNLISELNGAYSEDVARVKIDDWVQKLEEENNRYAELVKEGYEEEAGRTELKLKEVRTNIDIVFRQIVERLEALMVVEGEEKYKEFVRRLNIQLEHYINILAQRQGIAKAEKEKKKEEESND